MRKKDKLYTVNRFNRSMFEPGKKENLFDGLSGSSQMQTGKSNPFGITPLTAPTVQKPIDWSNPISRGQAIAGMNAMRRDFSDYANNVVDNFGKGPLVQNNSPFQSTSMLNTDPNTFFNGSSAGKKEIREGVSSGIGKAVLNAGIGAVAGTVGGLAGNAISGGLESSAGNAIGSIGSTLGSAVGMVNPVLGAAVGVGSQLVGGLVNRAFGTSVDQAKLNAAKEGTAAYNNFVSNAGSFDGIHGPASQANVQDAYKGGWFTSGKARRKNAELKEARLESKLWAERGVDNNVDNLIKDQTNNALANYSAFGGPLDVIGYDLMSDYLQTKRKNAENKNQMTNLFMGSPSTMFSFGGDMQTNYGDYSTGLTHIDAGQSHELNPNDGVQIGTDNEGIPNLVEEGEVIWDDYVFSNRILLDAETKKVFHFPKKKDLTYADAAKKLEKEIAERPNDPVSRAGFNAQMQQLEEQQERQKQEMEAQRAKEAFEALSPEEQVAVMESAAQQEAMAQEVATQQAKAEQQAIQSQQAQEQAAMQQPSPEEIAGMQQQAMQADNAPAMVEQQPIMAEGGHLFRWGGYDNLFSINPSYVQSKRKGFLPYDKKLTPEEVKKLEQEQQFIDWTNYVNEHWDEEYVQNYLKALDKAAGGNHLFDKEGKVTANAKKYFNNARTKNHLWGYYHLTPEQIAESEELKEVNPDIPRPKGSYTPTIKDIDPEAAKVLESNGIGMIPKEEEKVSKSESKAPVSVDVDHEEKEIVPNLKKETSIGMFGPAVGLGLMAAGLGKPDTSELFAAANSGGNYREASWMPRGDFAVYRPDDPWFYTMPIMAQANATQRAIGNRTSPSKGAETLANSYHTIIGLGNAQRQALEHGDDKYLKYKSYNADVYKSNQGEYGANSRFNATAYNEAARNAAHMQMQAAAQKMDADRWWASNLYGNVNSLFDNINQWEKWKRDRNTIAKMYADSLAGTVTPETNVAKGLISYGKPSAEGGKIKRKKGRRGLTS